MSPGQGLGHGLMGCMVLCRTFHTTPEQGQRPEQGRMVYRPIFQALKRSGTRQCDYIIRAHLHQVSASTCGNSAMVLAILFSLKSMETFENGLQPHSRASSQICRSVHADAWCKHALGYLNIAFVRKLEILWLIFLL